MLFRECGAEEPREPEQVLERERVQEKFAHVADEGGANWQICLTHMKLLSPMT